MAGGSSSEHLRNSNGEAQPPPSEAGGLSSHPISASSQNVMSFVHRLKPLLSSLLAWGLKE